MRISERNSAIRFLVAVSVAGSILAALLAAGAHTGGEQRREPLLGFERPGWMSAATTLSADAALECYKREAAWHGATYCASPVQHVLEVVWASCFGQERALLLGAAQDAGDSIAMDYLASFEARTSSEVTRAVAAAHSTSRTCVSSPK